MLLNGASPLITIGAKTPATKDFYFLPKNTKNNNIHKAGTAHTQEKIEPILFLNLHTGCICPDNEYALQTIHNTTHNPLFSQTL